MAESLTLKAKGLSRYSDPLSARPVGSLNLAENIVIDQEGLFSPRRGFTKLGGTFTGNIKNIFSYGGYLFVYLSSGEVYRYDENAGTYTEITGFVGAGGYIRSAEYNGNLYVTSSLGVFKLDSATSNTFVEAGVPQALHFAVTTSTSPAAEGSGSAVEADSTVGYRTVWGRKDSNNNLLLGAPSNPVLYSNTTAVAGTNNTQIVTPIPSEIQSTASLNWFCQLYRTAPISPASLTAVTDEYKLVYEQNYTSGTSLTIIDQTPVDIRESGLGLYTNATREGALSVNYQPPSCADMAVFNNHAFYADLAYRHTISFQLLATGSSAAYGLRENDTITIKRAGSTDEVYTAKYTPSAAKNFQLYPRVKSYAYTAVNTTSEIITISGHGLTAGIAVKPTSTATLPAELVSGTTYYVIYVSSTEIKLATSYANALAGTNINFSTQGTGTHTLSEVVSPSIDIRRTAEDFIAKVNANSLIVYAYYDSTEGSLPGLIRLEDKDYLTTAFTVQSVTASTAGAPFSPDLDTLQTSSREDIPNGLAYSKLGEPESVPTGYTIFTVGSKTRPILRIINLRDSLFIFKGDGIWRLTGTSIGNFAVDAFDSSAKVIAPNTLCVLNNLVFGLFDQGVCQVSESGVSILSLDIEGDIRGWIGSHLALLSIASFGLPYETDRKYMMWVPTSPSDLYPITGYVYNTVTATWTTFDRSSWASIVSPVNDRLYIAGGGRQYLSKERKDATYTDFADEQTSMSVSSVNGAVLTVASVGGAEVGDMYVESSSKSAKVTAVDTGPSTITLEVDLDWIPDTLMVTASNVSGNDITVDTVDKVSVGDTVTQGVNTTTISSFNSTTKVITLASGTGFMAGVCTITTQWSPEVRKQYLSTVEWNPVHLNSPGHLKQWFEALIMLTKDFNTATVSFKTEQDSGWEGVDLSGYASDAWGLFPWGEAPWGGGGEVEFAHRTYIPRTKQKAATMHVRMEINTIYSGWEMSGFELTYRDAGYRFLRR